jgi:ribosome modulation factor
LRTYESAAIKAKTMKDVTSEAEREYWLGYRIGMIDSKGGRDQRTENPGWRDTDSIDELRAARCRGYAAGLNWKSEA